MTLGWCVGQPRRLADKETHTKTTPQIVLVNVNHFLQGLARVGELEVGGAFALEFPMSSLLAQLLRTLYEQRNTPLRRTRETVQSG